MSDTSRDSSCATAHPGPRIRRRRGRGRKTHRVMGFNDGTVLRKARRELHLRRIGSPVHEIGLAVSRCDERGRRYFIEEPWTWPSTSQPI